MKKKTAKLSLKRQTISNLSNVELDSLKGGTAESGSGCTYCTYCWEHSIAIDTKCYVNPGPDTEQNPA